MKKLIIILCCLIVALNSFSQDIKSNNSFIFQPTTNPVTTFRIKGIFSSDSAIYLPIRNNNWTPTKSGAIQFSPTQSAPYYYNMDSAKWLLLGGGSGGTPPSLATLTPGYGLIGVTYNPYSTNQTWLVDTSQIASITYINNFFGDTTIIFPFNAQDRTNTPPTSPADSTWWLVGHNPTGVWTALADKLVQRIGTGYAPYDEPTGTVVNTNKKHQQWQKVGDVWQLKATFIVNNGNAIRLPIYVGTQDLQSLVLQTHDTARFFIDSIGRKFYPEYAADTSTQYTIGSIFKNGYQDTIHSRDLILTTTGSSGAATLINNVLNIPQYSGGSGGNSDSTWQQIIDGSNSFEGSVNGNFHGINWSNDSVHNFSVTNANQVSFEANNGNDAGEFNFNPSYVQLDNNNDSLSSFLGTNITESTVDGVTAKTEITSSYTNSDDNTLSRQHHISIYPDYIYIWGLNGTGIDTTTQLKISGLDSSDADPNNVAWFDANSILHRGHISSGGSGVASVASGDGSITVTNPTTTVDLSVVKAPKLQTARTIGTTTGDATSAGSIFDGTANNTNALTLATVNSNVGSFTNANITVNAKGLITAAANGTTSSGTVTSVAALTLGTTGTDLSSTVANSTTTPVITLNVPTASASNRGALSSTDWTTFNNKQATISVTTPITLTGASVGMVNQGTTTTVLHGNASGNPSFGSVVNADITNATIVASTKLSATGTPSSTTYLRGDDTWATVSGGSSYNPIYYSSLFGVDSTGATDATSAVQALINMVVTNGGGTIVLQGHPIKIAGAINAACNCQISIPYSATEVNLIIEGETAGAGGNFTGSIVGFDTTKFKTTLYSTYTGTASISKPGTAVIGFLGGGTSRVNPLFKGFNIMPKNNPNGHGVEIGGISGDSAVRLAGYDNLSYEIDTPFVNTHAQEREVFGFSTPNNNLGNNYKVNNIVAQSVRWGVVFGEHVQADNINTTGCWTGLGIKNGYQSSVVTRFVTQENVNGTGFYYNQSSSPAMPDFTILDFNQEFDAGDVGKPYHSLYSVDDSLNVLHGKVFYSSTTAGVGQDSTYFFLKGGQNVAYYRFGDANQMLAVDKTMQYNYNGLKTLTLKNTNSTGRFSFNIQNDRGIGGGIAAVGSASTTTLGTWKNALTVAADSTLLLIANTNVASGGTKPIDLITDGYNGTYNLRLNGTNTALFSGSIGMGTITSPSYKIDINSGTNNDGIRVAGTSASNGNGFYAVNSSGNSIALTSYGTSFSSPANWTGKGVLGSAVGMVINSGTSVGSGGSENMDFQTGGYNANYTMRLTGGNPGNALFGGNVGIVGSVGIGTSSPSAPLQIFATRAASFGQFSIKDASNSGTATNLYESYYGANGTRVMVIGMGKYQGGTDANYYLMNEDGAGVVLGDGTNYRFTFSNAGAMTFGVAPSTNSETSPALLIRNASTGNIEQRTSLPIKYAHTIFTPTTGGTVATVVGQYNIINPAGALLALTVNLPSSPANNDVVYIKFTQNVTTVTYGNGTVVDGITAPTAGGLTVLVYDSGTTSWY